MSTPAQTARLRPEDWRALMQPRRLYALDLGPEGEAAFRALQRRRNRLTRVILFGIHALFFTLSPLHNSSLFRAPEALQPLMQLLELGVVLPVLLTAIALTWLRGPSLLVQTAQTAAVLSLWGAALCLRYLALTEDFDYPSSMLGIMVIAVALFGSFSCRRIAAGALLFIGLGVTLEFWQARPDGNPLFEVYALALMGVVAILGAYTIELFARHSWISYQYAAALARTDALTGLSNRHDFNRLFPRCLQQAARERQGVGVMLLDIDHFKTINDRHGHPFGDEVLAQVGARLRQSVALRPLDLIARFGGEELVVVWYGVEPSALPALGQRVLDALRELRLEPRPGEPLSVTASAGLLWLRPEHPVQPERVLRQTDELLYRAKAEGRDRLVAGDWQPG